MNRLSLTGPIVVLCLGACQSQSLAPTGITAEAGTLAEVATLSASGVSGAASGSGHVLFDFGVPLPYGISLRKFGFSAIRLQDGTVTGQWEVVVGSPILHGTIDCLVIAPGGQSARISGLVTYAKFTTFQVGTAFALELFDNGNGASGTPDVTTQLLAFRNAAPGVGLQFCLDGTIPAGADLQPLPMDHGNFSIRVDD